MFDIENPKVGDTVRFYCGGVPPYYSGKILQIISDGIFARDFDITFLKKTYIVKTACGYMFILEDGFV